VCLSIVGQVVATAAAPASAGERLVSVRVNGTVRRVNAGLLDDLAVGDWVLVHLGYATARLDADEAQRTLALLDEFARSSAGL
jgi:hydrogenase assembly chaperone HypC/HupF